MPHNNAVEACATRTRIGPPPDVGVPAVHGNRLGVLEMSAYREIVIETYLNPGEPTDAPVRARPLPGQGLNIRMKVECSRRMREKHPVGTKFLIRAKVTDREGGSPFLYAHYNAKYEVLSDAPAATFIRERYDNA